MRHSGFTLIEILIVIAVIAILSVVVILSLNPAELIRQSRDSNRLSDMDTLSHALGLASIENMNLGLASTTYVSVPDPTATTTAGDQCQGLGLPSLPSGYVYHCAASSTYKNTNGQGWIPVVFTQLSVGPPIGVLPVDLINTTSSCLYYIYMTDGARYELTMAIESQKYSTSGPNNVESNDGGQYPDLYEKGTNLTLAPMDFCTAGQPGWIYFNIPKTVTNQANQTSSLVFTGIAGQIIDVAGTSTFGFNVLTITILKPDGSTLTTFNTTYGGGFNSGRTTLPVSGTYSIILTSGGGTTGIETIYLTQEVDGGIAINTPAAANMSLIGQLYGYTFTGSSGQVIDIAGTSSFGFNVLTLTLLKPDGSTLTSFNSTYGGGFALNLQSLPVNGTYALRIDPAANAGNAAVTLTQEVTSTIAFNTPTAGNMPNIGQSLGYTFTGTSGQVIHITGTSSFGFNVLTLTLLKPDDSTLTSFNSTYGGGFDSASTSLPTTGTYTITINPGGNAGNVTIDVAT